MYTILTGSFLVIAILWIIVLEWRFHRIERMNKELMKVSRSHSLQTVLETILKSYNEWQKDKAEIQEFMETTEKSLEHTLRDVGFLRYDSFEDVGGKQSFSMLFLTPKLDGVVISALHDRIGTKIYAKRIMEGEPQHNLSNEEKRLLEEVLS